jgi:hypothetical protein
MTKRKIKFRAWHKKKKEMFFPDVHYGVNWDLAGDILLHWWEGKPYKKNYLKDNIELMQYTGLKDKNGKGKEIYEGDILMFETGERQGYMKEVVFEDGKFKPIADELKSFSDLDCEIIGNIYENPELLE